MKTLKQYGLILVICTISDIAAGDRESAPPHFAFFNNQFHEAPQCQTLAIPFSPYFVLNTQLSNTQHFLKKGILIDHTKRKVIRSWEDLQETTLNITLPDSLLDTADQWKIKLISTQEDSLLFPLAGKILELQKAENRFLVQNCCTGSSCQILPLYKVYENQKWIASLAFHPKKSSFIHSYSLIKGSETLVAPQFRMPPQSSPNLTVAADEKKPESFTSPSASQAPLEQQQYIVCTRSEPLKIYDDTLNTVLYRIQRSQPIQVFQGWDGKNIEKSKGSIRLVKVQAENARGQEITGWAAYHFIKKPADCEGFSLIGSPTGETLIEGSTIVVDNTTGTYRFPTAKKPMYDYVKGSGRRYFGAPRDGRLHAAADLFRPQNENIYAIASGTVLRKYYFYSGTYAIEVKHDTGPVVRYGEVSQKDVPQSMTGDRVIKGQHLSYIGHLGMLHFEMYSGTKTGPLTQKGSGSFSRRSDLIDPTSYLKTWEKETF